jgi:colicin import membrane protein
MLGRGKKDFKPWLQLLGLIRESIAKGHRKFLLASFLVHLLVVIAISWSWSATEAVKTYAIPTSVQARVLTQAEVESLPYKLKEKELEALRQQKLQEEKRKAELAKKKALEERRKREAQKKEQARREAEKKRQLAIKKKQEDAAKKKQELERLKRLEELERAQKAAKAKELLEKERKQKAELDRLSDLAKSREAALQEKRLAERMAALNDLKASSSSDEVSMDMDEQTRYMSIIKSRIESRWFVPPNTQNMVVLLRIQLLPSGELAKVEVLRTSGSSALDQSALAAVRAVGRFEVPRDPKLFEKYFRSIQMSFTPPE